jgi:hypothetical protein
MRLDRCIYLLSAITIGLSHCAIAAELSSSAAVTTVDTNPFTPLQCSTGLVLPPGQASCSVVGNDNRLSVDANANAFVNQNGLGAAVFSQVLLMQLTATPYSTQAQAQGTLDDFLTFVGNYPAQARVTALIETTGTYSGSNVSATSELTLTNGSSNWDCLYDLTGTCSVQQIFSVSGGLGLQLSLGLSAIASVVGFPGAMQTESMDFSNTERLAGLSFADLAGNPLSLSYTSALGFTYPMALEPSAAPEPGTLTLFGFGLAGLSVTRRRKH